MNVQYNSWYECRKLLQYLVRKVQYQSQHIFRASMPAFSESHGIYIVVYGNRKSEEESFPMYWSSQ